MCDLHIYSPIMFHERAQKVCPSLQNLKNVLVGGAIVSRCYLFQGKYDCGYGLLDFSEAEGNPQLQRPSSST